MIEEILLNFLTARLSCPVDMELPKNPPAEIVIIEKTGSSQDNNFIHQSTFAIQSYANSLYNAARLNEEVKDTLLDGLDGLITVDNVTKIELNSDYNFTDTSTKKYRYQAVFDITHY